MIREGRKEGGKKRRREDKSCDKGVIRKEE